MIHLTMRRVLVLLTAITSLVGYATSETPTSIDTVEPVPTAGDHHVEIRPIGPLDDIEHLGRVEAYLPVASTGPLWQGELGSSYALLRSVKIYIKPTSARPKSGEGYPSPAKPGPQATRSANAATTDVNDHIPSSRVLRARVETMKTPTRPKGALLVIRTRREATLSKSTLSSTSSRPVTTVTVPPGDRIGGAISVSASTITSTETPDCRESIPISPSADGKLTSSTVRSVVFSTTLVTATSTRTRTTVTVTASSSSVSSAETSHVTSTSTTATAEASTSGPTKSTPTSAADSEDPTTSTMTSSTKSPVLTTSVQTTHVNEQTSTTKAAEPASSTIFTTPTRTSSTSATDPNSSYLTSCTKWPTPTPTSQIWSTTFEISAGNSSATASDHTLTITGTGGIAFSAAKKSKIWSVLGSSCTLASLIYYLLS